MTIFERLAIPTWDIPVPCWYIHVLLKILYFKLVENWKTQMVFLEGSDLDFEMTQV